MSKFNHARIIRDAIAKAIDGKDGTVLFDIDAEENSLIYKATGTAYVTVFSTPGTTDEYGQEERYHDSTTHLVIDEIIIMNEQDDIVLTSQQESELIATIENSFI
jgi:hypothetical protein